MAFFKKDYFWLILIILATFISYYPSLSFEFYTYLDDGKLITQNQVVTEFPKYTKEIFSDFVFGLYHPATTLSFILDYQLFGANPFGFRLHNLLLHLLNTLLAFVLIKRLTRNSYISLFSTLIFALHPMHMESVIWISERKDVLYSFYFLLAAICYLYYRENKGNKYLILLIATFTLSLLSKAAAVVLPVIFVIFDYYYEGKFTFKQFVSKWYLFMLSVIFGIINIKAQNTIDFIQPIAYKYTAAQLFTIPVYAFTWYVTQFFIPIKLAAKHLYPRVIAGEIANFYYLAWLWLACLGFLFYRFRKNRLFVSGTLFYIASIALLIKLILTGNDIVSERYSYIPYIGLSLALGSLTKWIEEKKTLPFLFISLIIFYAGYTLQHSKNWKSEKEIWTRVSELQPDMALAYFELGNYHKDKKDYSQAIIEYKNATKHAPNMYAAYANIALCNIFMQNFNDAKEYLNQAIAINPEKPDAYFNRGNINLRFNKLDEAESDFKKAQTLGFDKTKTDQALQQITEAKNKAKLSTDDLLRLSQTEKNTLPHLKQLAQKYYQNQEFNKAKESLIKILSQEDSPEFKYYLANTYAKLENYSEAVKYYSQVIDAEPNNPRAYINRGNAYLFNDKPSEACQDWQEAMKLGATQVKPMIEKYCK